MLNLYKKFKNAYQEAEKYKLDASAFIFHRIISKSFGNNQVGRWLQKIVLGQIGFDDVLRQVKGKVLHIGACRAEEADLYKRHGLDAIFIEANPALENELKNNLSGKQGMEYIIALVLDCEGHKTKFNISSSIESSSTLDFSKLATDHLWPDLDLEMVSTIILESTTIAALVESSKLRIDGIDHIVIDTQGTELKVLQGMPKKLLEQASFVTIEASTIAIYEGQDLFPDIKQFLAGFSYRPLWHPVSPHADLTFKRRNNESN